jgi:hypothetical protein
MAVISYSMTTFGLAFAVSAIGVIVFYSFFWVDIMTLLFMSYEPDPKASEPIPKKPKLKLVS